MSTDQAVVAMARERPPTMALRTKRRLVSAPITAHPRR